MDPKRFDDLTRALGAGVSRRQALKLLGATGVAGFFGFGRPQQASASLGGLQPARSAAAASTCVFCNCNNQFYIDPLQCLSECHVSLACFTGICGPVPFSCACCPPGTVCDEATQTCCPPLSQPCGSTCCSPTQICNQARGQCCAAPGKVTPESQGNPSWGGQLYDNSATLTIANRGCGLTSLSMALNCAGVPNDPDSLNDFLKENGGYNGLQVDWDITRKVSLASGHSPLKFIGFTTNSPAGLADALCQSNCGVIVGVNFHSDGTPCPSGSQCHFVLVTGMQGDRFQIADPAGKGSFLDGPPYNSSFVTRGWVADPAGDISGLDVIVQDAALLITNDVGQQSGVDPVTGTVSNSIPRSSAFADSLADDVTGEQPTDVGSYLQIFQPSGGLYRIDVTPVTSGTNDLVINAFSADGTPQPRVVLPVTGGVGATTTFQVMYSSAPGAVLQVAGTATWNAGDVFAGVGNGTYQVRDPDSGAVKDIIQASGGFTTGCTFDAAGNFYGTWFAASQVFKAAGGDSHTASPFGSGYSTPESIRFDKAGRAYVGNLGDGIRQYDASGSFLKTVTSTRVDWFDLAADQDTILYTQEGNDIKRVSVSSGASLPDFTTGTATVARALRILPDGGVLLADLVNVKRYDTSGHVVRTYTAGGENSWEILDLDPNGTSFWAGNSATANYYRFNIATGAIESGPVNTGSGGGTLFGICLKPGVTSGGGQHATTTTYTGDSAQDFDDVAHLGAHLADNVTNQPVADATVTFTLGSQSCTGTTNSGGDATCDLTISQAAGTSYQVTATYSGDATHKGSNDSKPFTINLEQTALHYTGPPVFAVGQPARLSGVLKEDDTTPIAGRTIVFTLGGGASAQTCSGTTDATGTATCTITAVSQPLGPGSATAQFAGDAFYQPASSATTATLAFAYLAAGSFVVGDKNASLGMTVTFWSAQWAQSNALSGGPAPAGFKGFAASLSRTPPTCGSTWSTSPANSAGPPDNVPSYMAAVVSSSITQSGSTISGNAPAVIVLQTAGGYAPDTGHTGTGTVAAVVCPSPRL